MTTYIPLPKVTNTSYHNSTGGLVTYDDQNLTYDDLNTMYDGMTGQGSYVNIPKVTSTTYIKIPKAN